MVVYLLLWWWYVWSGPTSLFTKVLCHLNDEAQVIIDVVGGGGVPDI